MIHVHPRNPLTGRDLKGEHSGSVKVHECLLHQHIATKTGTPEHQKRNPIKVLLLRLFGAQTDTHLIYHSLRELCFQERSGPAEAPGPVCLT